MLPISTTRFLILPQASAQIILSPRHDGSNEISMTFMFGDVHSTFWTRQSLMERNVHVGNQELLEESSWVSAQIMRVLFPLFSTWKLEPSPHNFILFLMIGSLQFLPVLMISQTSTPQHGPRCLETVSTNSSGMKMTPKLTLKTP